MGCSREWYQEGLDLVVARTEVMTEEEGGVMDTEVEAEVIIRELNQGTA